MKNDSGKQLAHRRNSLAGDQVTALVRNPANLSLTHPNLKVIKGDIMHPETYEGYLVSKEVVISAIGVNAIKPTTLYSEGNKNLLKAMDKKGVKRAFFFQHLPLK